MAVTLRSSNVEKLGEQEYRRADCRCGGINGAVAAACSIGGPRRAVWP